jgi:hypothetical protein
MARIFISYSRVDEAFARQLAKTLSEYGADVWIDVEDIPAGMKWSSAIQQIIFTIFNRFISHFRFSNIR